MTPRNLPNSIGVPGGAPNDLQSVGSFLTQLVNGLNNWIVQAATAINSLLSDGAYAESNITSPISLVSTTPTNLTSLTLAAGDWDVWGNIQYIAGGATTLGEQLAGLSTVSATFGPDNRGYGQFSPADTVGSVVAPSILRVNVTVPTTVYMVGMVSFSPGTCSMTGVLQARLVR